MRVGVFAALAVVSAAGFAITGNLQSVLFAAAAAFWWHSARQEWRKDSDAKASAREALRARLLGRRQFERAR